MGRVTSSLIEGSLAACGVESLYSVIYSTQQARRDVVCFTMTMAKTYYNSTVSLVASHIMGQIIELYALALYGVSTGEI